jgi:hypothetical protein
VPRSPAAASPGVPAAHATMNASSSLHPARLMSASQIQSQTVAESLLRCMLRREDSFPVVCTWHSYTSGHSISCCASLMQVSHPDVSRLNMCSSGDAACSGRAASLPMETPPTSLVGIVTTIFQQKVLNGIPSSMLPLLQVCT